MQRHVRMLKITMLRTKAMVERTPRPWNFQGSRFRIMLRMPVSMEIVNLGLVRSYSIP